MMTEGTRQKARTVEACSDQDEAKLASDLLEGAEAIADFVYGDPKKRRKIYYLVEQCRFPAFRMGAVLHARKSTVMAWIAEQERKVVDR